MKRLVLGLFLLTSPAHAGEVSFLVPFVEILSAYTWKDNYKRLPQLTEQNIPRHREVLSTIREEIKDIRYYPCENYYAEDESGLVCKSEDGTWEIKEFQKN